MNAALSNKITTVNGPVTSSGRDSQVPRHILYLVIIQSVNCHNYSSLIVYHIRLVDVSVSNLVTTHVGQ